MKYTEYVPYTRHVEVIEKRAPTDDSIRIYKELQEKAEKNLIAQERFVDNELKGVVTYIEQSAAVYEIKAHIRFSINDKDHHNIVTVPRNFSSDRQKGLELLYTAIMHELAKTFTIDFNNIKGAW